MDKSQEKICHELDASPEKGPHEDGRGSKCKTEEEFLSYKEVINRAAGIAWRFPLIEMQGVPLRNYIVQKWSNISAFCPDPSDMLIATYPKAGTTWTQEIVDLLLHNGDEEACKRASTSDRFPFLEIQYPPPIPSGLDLLKNMKPPRVIKTHLPIQLVPKGFWENKCKVIYVARNAKDNLVSYYHFDRMNQAQPQPGPWEEYIQKFMRGKVAWGSWYDHVKDYWKEREKRNILYLFFEDLKKDPRREVERIMRYMDLSVTDDVIDKIVQLTSFKNMRDNPMANYTFIPKIMFDHSISPFMRRGEVGDWTNHFTPAQSQMFDEDYARQMADVDIPFCTSI
ncbi:sulfotransferase 1C2-like [Pygocentrus nattereri]|uniref:sulfotransferase 1C2-like n=1 Tax=Pygocentrus nattereri TaxID=42514 RepID=UPI001890DAEF|nr:sulfotransferase 1C2-like [Pygocentrus nattereri]XP_037400059.1 sulfotransferase 1C2-like [Pygocentrus nattereri]